VISEGSLDIATVEMHINAKVRTRGRDNSSEFSFLGGRISPKLALLA